MLNLVKLVKRTKRLGRGYGSGKGGHTVGRGQKGQKSRGKGKPGILHEGGNVPLHRRLPMLKGYRNKPVTEYTEITLQQLLRAIEKANTNIRVITPKVLQKLGFKPAKDGYKIIGTAEVNSLTLKFRGVKLSKGVKQLLKREQ